MDDSFKIKLVVGDSFLTATLNNNVSAKDLVRKLPLIVGINRGAIDYCGRLSSSLESDRSDAQRGWKNGDISYIPGADWIAFFFGGEKDSMSDDNPQHIIGRVDDITALNNWPSGSISVRIEKA